MVDIRALSLIDALSLMGGLSVSHQSEMESHVPYPLDLNMAVYVEAERSGSLVIVGAFVDDTPVGYAAALVYPHLHYSVPIATHDVLYLRPDARKGPAGVRLMRALVQGARERGAQIMVWSAKPGSTFDRILRRRGLPIEEHVYQEVL